MKLPAEGVLLRIFIGASDLHDGEALYHVIVRKAREMNLAGATVLRGIEGFGAASRIHTASILRLSEDLPIVIEIVDREDKVRALLPFLDEVVREGLVTMERVQVITYRHRQEEDG
ncbi:MAG: DUF190 domain-containing protein [Bacteroidetes bacterium]|nr:MAG: DUF190 domain-containing protein [Bacteroidota bacterium]